MPASPDVFSASRNGNNIDVFLYISQALLMLSSTDSINIRLIKTFFSILTPT